MRAEVNKAMMDVEEFLESQRFPYFYDTMGAENVLLAIYQSAIFAIRRANPGIKTFGDLEKVRTFPNNCLKALTPKEVPPGKQNDIKNMWVIQSAPVPLGIILAHEILNSYGIQREYQELPPIFLALGTCVCHSCIGVIKSPRAAVLVICFDPKMKLTEIVDPSISDLMRHELQHYFQSYVTGWDDADMTEFSKPDNVFEQHAMGAMFGGAAMRMFVIAQSIFYQENKGEVIFEGAVYFPDRLREMAGQFWEKSALWRAKDVFDKKFEKQEGLSEIFIARSKEFFDHCVERWIQGKENWMEQGFCLPVGENIRFECIKVEMNSVQEAFDEAKDEDFDPNAFMKDAVEDLDMDGFNPNDFKFDPPNGDADTFDLE